MNYSTTNKQPLNLTDYASPDYVDQLENWKDIYAVCQGERFVKDQGETYLPKTGGQKDKLDQYNAYKKDAIFKDEVSKTITNSIGFLHNKKSILTPAKDSFFDCLREDTFIKGNGGDIFELHKDINQDQLKYGRGGYLLDVNSQQTGKPLPEIVKYDAFAVLNVVDDAETKLKRYVFLNESCKEFNKVTKKFEDTYKIRVLGLDQNGKYYTALLDNQEFIEFDVDNPDEEKAIYPDVHGNTIDFIPFYIANISHTKKEIEPAILLEQAQLCLHAYSKSAGYYRQVKYQGAELLFISGVQPADLNDWGYKVDGILATTNKEASAQYVGIGAEGLAETRTAYEKLLTDAENFGSELIEGAAREAAAALEIKDSNKKSNLWQIQNTAEEVLNKMIEDIKIWWNKPDEDLQYIANKNFGGSILTIKAILEHWTMVVEGGATKEDHYKMLVDNNRTKFEDFDEWESSLTENYGGFDNEG